MHERPLSVEMLCRWHATLMAGSPMPGGYIGVVRREQGWIGGTSPIDAALVTPPPDRLDELLADLVAYANRDDIDAVAQAGDRDAQFEIIHPFADGNGRIGRVLISWLLVRGLALVTPPPVSVRIAAERDGYLAGLTLFRLGHHDRWVQWFADVVTGAGQAQVALVRGGRRAGASVARPAAQPRAPDARSARHAGLARPRPAAAPSRAHRITRRPRARPDDSRRASAALGELVEAGVLTEVGAAAATRARSAGAALT